MGSCCDRVGLGGGCVFKREAGTGQVEEEMEGKSGNESHGRLAKVVSSLEPSAVVRSSLEYALSCLSPACCLGLEFAISG